MKEGEGDICFVIIFLIGKKFTKYWILILPVIHIGNKRRHRIVCIAVSI